MPKVLVTDSLFIFDEHIAKLKQAGYEVERLNESHASEDILISSLRDKVGYIVGGIEQVTAKVIENAPMLKAIVFTGADYKFFIPGWEKAQEKGIAIANTPGANADAVSEFALATALAMQRNLFELGRTGNKSFETTNSIKDAVVAVVGAGKIGAKIIEKVSPFQPKEILYVSPSEKQVAAKKAELDVVMRDADIVFVCVPAVAGKIFSEPVLKQAKNNQLIVCISTLDIFDEVTLYERLEKGTIRAAFDWPAPNEKYSSLPLSIWFNTNDHTAFNTYQASKLSSDMAVDSLINLLQGKADDYRVV